METETVVMTRGAYPVLSWEALYTAPTRAKDEVCLVVEQGPSAQGTAMRFALREGSRRQTVLEDCWPRSRRRQWRSDG